MTEPIGANDFYTIENAEADVKRQGSDVTLVSFNKMMKVALGAASELEKEGVSVEVIVPARSNLFFFGSNTSRMSWSNGRM